MKMAAIGLLLLLSCGVSQVGCSARIALAGSEPSEVVLQTIAMESANQPAAGQALVALTLINRARNRHTTPEIEALRPFQYSCWNEGGKWAKAWLAKYYTPEARQRAMKAWYQAQEMDLPFTHYHTKNVRPYWVKSMKFMLQNGNHLFYAEKQSQTT